MHRPRMLIATAALGLALVAGCSSTPELGPVFDDELGQPISCLVHQSGEPGARYTERAQRDTGQMLALMKYYTQHGNRPFCDGLAAGDSDRAWAQAYLALGGTADRVAGVLG